jgi:hypothetical protein
VPSLPSDRVFSLASFPDLRADFRAGGRPPTRPGSGSVDQNDNSGSARSSGSAGGLGPGSTDVRPGAKRRKRTAPASAHTTKEQPAADLREDLGGIPPCPGRVVQPAGEAVRVGLGQAGSQAGRVAGGVERPGPAVGGGLRGWGGLGRRPDWAGPGGVEDAIGK